MNDPAARLSPCENCGALLADRARTFKVVLGLLALAISYTIFWALAVSVAGMYAFVRA